MKAVLISIKPKWCELIASGKKTVEVRKTRPKFETPFKCYIYCTKPKGNYDWGLCCDNLGVGRISALNYGYAKEHEMTILSGKVIGEFVCDQIDEYCYGVYEDEHCYHIPTVEGEKTGLEYTEAEEYGKGKPLYFWHISNLVIYETPKKLSEFRIDCKGGCDIPYLYAPPCEHCRKDRLTRPPQSWCYVEDLGGV